MAILTIAIDCMGGDFGPSVTIPAVQKVLFQNLSQLNSKKSNESGSNEFDSGRFDFSESDLYLSDTNGSNSEYSLHFQLFGDTSKIEPLLIQYDLSEHPNISVFASQDDVLMTDKPSLALKKKKKSSMRLALESLRDGRVNACVSAGNTGALMAISRFILKMLPGLTRPAIISGLPTVGNELVYLLDLGANVECDETRLAQFAIMGNELCKCISNVKEPKVGLLNVGEEEIKGSDKLRCASKLISNLEGINYCGFVEANQIFSGEFNVIVTDGFTGNSVLKASEGLSLFLMAKIKMAFQKNWWTRFCGLLAKPVINLFKDEVNPEKYNGACLVGLRGIVIKSHGSANVDATVCAIEEAISLSLKKVPYRIRQSLESASNKLEV